MDFLPKWSHESNDNIGHPHVCLLPVHTVLIFNLYWPVWTLAAKELSQEVERLHNLLSEKLQCSNNNENYSEGQLKSPCRCQVNLRDLSKGSAGRMMLKLSSGDQTEEARVSPNAGQEVHVMDKEPEGGPIKGTPSNSFLEKLQLVRSLNFGSRWNKVMSDGETSFVL